MAGLTVDVYHNVSTEPLRMLNGYRDGDPLVHVFTVTVPEDKHPLTYCWWLLNVGHEGDPPDPQAELYRTRRNRSLSVGDVLIIDGAAHACGSIGWDKVDVKPEQTSVQTPRAIWGTSGIRDCLTKSPENNQWRCVKPLYEASNGEFWDHAGGHFWMTDEARHKMDSGEVDGMDILRQMRTVPKAAGQ